MSKKPIILGIETSCDETAVSLIQEEDNGIPKILSNIVSSQFDIHKEFGGVVPELAARSHVEKIDLISKKAIKESGVQLNDISAIAATSGPGLIVCLTVGLNFGKALASSLGVPFIGVNHLEGHALSPKINQKIEFPYLLLLISGGHTQFLEVNGINNYKRLGTTIDDALGEAFDKTAKLLGIEFPGGPEIEKWAKKGDKNYFKLPKPIFKTGGCNLSFAGLKTAVLRKVEKLKNQKEKYHLAASFQQTINEILYEKTKVAMDDFLKNKKNKKNIFVIAGGVASNMKIRENLIELSKEIKNHKEKYHLAASFQKTINEILYEKTRTAMKEFLKNKNIKEKTFVIAGGVAANLKIRENLSELAKKEKFSAIFPPKNLCSDNAAMIAWTGIERYKINLIDSLEFPSKPRWPLDSEAPYLKGSGVKI